MTDKVLLFRIYRECSTNQSGKTNGIEKCGEDMNNHIKNTNRNQHIKMLSTSLTIGEKPLLDSIFVFQIAKT